MNTEQNRNRVLFDKLHLPHEFSGIKLADLSKAVDLPEIPIEATLTSE